jgi:hypothetical protein
VTILFKPKADTKKKADLKPAAAKPAMDPAPAKSDQEETGNEAEKFDLITIVESVEKEIPDMRPPVESILYDFIPENQQRVMARKDDIVSSGPDES